jgi:serine/threonine protein kinase
MRVLGVMLSEHEVFTEALTLSDNGERMAYLDRVCGADTSKRQRLNELLELHTRVDSVLEKRPQEIIESLNSNLESVDVADHEPAFNMAALKPYFEVSSHADSIGKLSHYELLEVLGQGGYGIVFKALDTKLNRLVAIKILSPHLAATSPPRRRFLREARAAAAVRHENVVQIYAVEEVPIPYLVMEFVSGETLQQRSDRLGPFDPLEVIRLGQQIARGLAAAHDSGLIHRDIKPGNILIEVGIEPVAKLSDFGLARTADDASRSQSGIVVGTPMYMSPEQVRGDEVDQRTDLFSFGSVLYLMASGRPPFRAPNTLAVLKRVAEDRPRSIVDVIPEVPEGLNSVVTRLHSKSREDRYSTAKDVESALATCLTNPPNKRQPRRSVLRMGGGRSRVVVIALFIATLGVGIGESAGWTNLIRRSRAANPLAVAANGGELPAEANARIPAAKPVLESPDLVTPATMTIVDMKSGVANAVTVEPEGVKPGRVKPTGESESPDDLSS